MQFHAHFLAPLPPKARRLERVVDIIDQSLTEDLSLDRLATSAAFSPFHFHRMFRALTGETVNGFVRRRRLETAAGRLRHCPVERVAEVSLACGFESSQAFARSFRQHFAMSPSEWRERSGGPWRGEAGGAQEATLPRQVAVRRRATFDLLYQRERGDYSVSTVPLWQSMQPWLQRLGLATAPRLSMALDDPTITSPGQCRLDACVEVPAGWFDSDHALLRRTMPAATYAVLRYAGKATELRRGWDVLLHEWLPGSAYTLAEGPFFARHMPGESSPSAGMQDCELHMPVRRKTGPAT